jgi:hypothetical protein
MKVFNQNQVNESDQNAKKGPKKVNEVPEKVNFDAEEVNDEASGDGSSKKKAGRRRKGEGPSFPREEVDRLLVHGELVEMPDGNAMHVVYPTYRDIAERFGVAHSIIADYAKQHNCLRRRERVQQRVQIMADTQLAEFRAHQLAVTRDDQVRAIDKFLVKFEEAIEEGRVRTDNPSDYNSMSRLKAFLLGDADSRQQLLNGMPSLEELQKAHKQLLETENELTPAVRGEVPLSNYSTTHLKKDETDEDEEENPEPGPDYN